MINTRRHDLCLGPLVDGNCAHSHVTHRTPEQKWRCDEHGVSPGLRGVCLLVVRLGKVLAISRRHNFSDFGLPGGKVDLTDRNDIFAIRRECREELGVEIGVPIPILSTGGMKNDGPGRCTTCFTAEIIGVPETQKGDGIVSWVPPELLLGESSFAEFNRKLFNHVHLPVQWEAPFWP